MGGSPIRKLAAGAAVVLVLTGVAIAAVTATGRSASPVRQAARAHRAAGRLGGGVNLARAARYLGMTTARLERELATGRTLAQIAAATSGRSEAGLIETLVAVRRAKLAAAAATLPSRVAAEVRMRFLRRPRAPADALAVRRRRRSAARG